jgi:hypothetical protein
VVRSISSTAFAIMLVAVTVHADTGKERPGYVVHPSGSGPVLLGTVTRANILEHFPDWPLELAGWEPDSASLAVLADLQAPVLVRGVLGTWCHDSQREVPRFWRMLDLLPAATPLSLEMIGVGRSGDDKASAALARLGFGDRFREENGIEFVPTFIVLDEDGNEVGRIVETPQVGLAEDLVALLVTADILRQTSGGGGMHYEYD